MNGLSLNQPVVLLILDGFGIAPPSSGNAISLAKKPNYDSLLQNYPNTQLQAAGEAVGIPKEEDGNSEVGHLNIGAGRIILQHLPRINLSIVDGSFFVNEAIVAAIKRAQSGKPLHLMGLIGSGGVHAYNDHLYALLQLAKKAGLTKVYLHLFTDGRDSPPTEAKIMVRKLETELKVMGIGEIVTLIGRYYAMDRDLRWERTEIAYKGLTEMVNNRTATTEEALERSYQKGITDEFLEPTQIGADPMATRIKDGDAVIFFNFRIDRPRQLTKAFVMSNFETTAMIIKGFDSYETKFHKKHVRLTPENTPFKRRVVLKDLVFVTMTEYEPGLPALVAYPPTVIPKTFGEVIAETGVRQLRLTETEKERFVTFYFNGGTNMAFKGEDRLMIPSPKVATYDLQPEMATPLITSTLIEQLSNKQYAFYVVNFACPDMVAHTGLIPPAVKAIEAVDLAIGQIVAKVRELGGVLVITADHGNAEEMFNGGGNDADTEHSTNPVPFVLVWDKRPSDLKLNTGVLADVAPTILKIMGIKQPSEMDGVSLF